MKLDLQLGTNGILVYQAHAEPFGPNLHKWRDSHRNSGQIEVPHDTSIFDLAKLVLEATQAADAERAVSDSQRQAEYEADRAREREIQRARRIAEQTAEAARVEQAADLAGD